jgi:heme exporter protein C
MGLIDLASPSRFLDVSRRLLPWLAAATLLGFVIAGVSVWEAPDDYQQGAAVKIMFIHVPAAWLALFAWVLMSAASLGTQMWLRKRQPRSAQPSPSCAW